jgi:hypothetical protein
MMGSGRRVHWSVISELMGVVLELEINARMACFTKPRTAMRATYTE